jgi:hypothetical protein
MTAAPLLGWSSTMSDTIDLGTLWRNELRPTTAELHVVFDMPPPPPLPAPARLPKRLRRRAAAHLADAFHSSILTRAALLATAVAGFATAIGAA